MITEISHNILRLLCNLIYFHPTFLFLVQYVSNKPIPKHFYVPRKASHCQKVCGQFFKS